MTTRGFLVLFKHALFLSIFVAATASTVTLLALAYAQPAPAVLVLALMTPVIASTAVQFYYQLPYTAGVTSPHARG